MTSRVQTLRKHVAGERPAALDAAPGVLYTNLVDKQIGVMDETRSPQDMVAVRYFSENAAYVMGDLVVQGGSIWRAKAARNAGPWDPLDFDELEAAELVNKVDKRGDVMSGPLTVPDGAAGKQVPNMDDVINAINTGVGGIPNFLPIGGGTLTGPVEVPDGAVGKQAPNMDDIIARIANDIAVAIAQIPNVDLTPYMLIADAMNQFATQGMIADMQTQTDAQATYATITELMSKADVTDPDLQGDVRANGGVVLTKTNWPENTAQPRVDVANSVTAAKAHTNSMLVLANGGADDSLEVTLNANVFATGDRFDMICALGPTCLVTAPLGVAVLRRGIGITDGHQIRLNQGDALTAWWEGPATVYLIGDGEDI